MITLEARPPNIEGQGEVRIRELVRNALRMRPDRIIVGEVRGAETLDMLQAMNTGHEGSLTTIHANSPRDALSRLETLVLTAGVELPLPRDPRADRERVRPARADLPPRRRLAPDHARHRGAPDGVRRDHAPGHLRREAARTRTRRARRSAGSCSRRSRARASSRTSSRRWRRTASSCRRTSSSGTTTTTAPRSPPRGTRNFAVRRPDPSSRPALAARRPLSPALRAPASSSRASTRARTRTSALTVVTPTPTAKPPRLLENGRPVTRPARREPRPREERRPRGRPLAVDGGQAVRRRRGRRAGVPAGEAAATTGWPSATFATKPVLLTGFSTSVGRRAERAAGARRRPQGGDDPLRQPRPVGTGLGDRVARRARRHRRHRRQRDSQRRDARERDRRRPRVGRRRLRGRDRERTLQPGAAQDAGAGHRRLLPRRRLEP